MNPEQIKSGARSILLFVAGCITALGYTKAGGWIESIANMESVIGIITALVTLAFGQWARTNTSIVQQAAAIPEVKTIVAEPVIANALPKSPEVITPDQAKVATKAEIAKGPVA